MSGLQKSEILYFIVSKTRKIKMNDARYFSLTHRIAEETQLLAEEKWIVEALNKIKTQRNCLQVCFISFVICLHNLDTYETLSND